MNYISKNISVFILAGGYSSRMGTNKALLEIEGRSVIQRSIELLEKIFISVQISSNEPELYKFTGKEIIKDIYPGKGPLAGIHSCLRSSDTEKNFFISCDLPFVSEELIRFLINYESDSKVILPKAEGRIQQLCGLYSKKVIDEAENLLNECTHKNSGLKGSIYELLERIDHEIIDITDQGFYHPDLFLNLNVPEDYLYAKKIIEKS